MLRALSLSFDQLADRAVLGVLAKSLAITLIVLGGLATLASLGVSHLFDRGVDGSSQHGHLAAAQGIAGALAAILIFFLGFRAVAIVIVNIFADEIVAAVEKKHYPQAAINARPVGIGIALCLGMASVGRLVLFNLIALPGYFVLAVTGIGAVALFWLVNALLLGRDLGEMVAVRHLEAAARARWLRSTRLERLALGAIATGLLLIPLLNLVAPVIGAAMATHLFHRRQA